MRNAPVRGHDGGPQDRIRVAVLGVLALLASAAGWAEQGETTGDVRLPALRAELLSMFDADQAAQQSVIHAGDDKQAAAEQLRELNARHLQRLKAIIGEHGWPGTDLVGEDGAHAAWLLVQHMDADPAFQERCLELLKVAVKGGRASGKDLAYLTDRVRVAQGQPQTYGTQFRQDGEFTVLAPVEDPEGLDRRRAELGLPTMDEYYRMMRETYPGIRLKEGMQ